MKIEKFEKRLRFISGILAGWSVLLIAISVISLIYDVIGHSPVSCIHYSRGDVFSAQLAIATIIISVLFLVVAFKGYNGKHLFAAKKQALLLKTPTDKLKSQITYANVLLYLLVILVVFVIFRNTFATFSRCYCSDCIAMFLRKSLSSFTNCGMSLYIWVITQQYKQELIKRELVQNRFIYPQIPV